MIDRMDGVFSDVDCALDRSKDHKKRFKPQSVLLEEEKTSESISDGIEMHDHFQDGKDIGTNRETRRQTDTTKEERNLAYKGRNRLKHKQFQQISLDGDVNMVLNSWLLGEMIQLLAYHTTVYGKLQHIGGNLF